MSAAAESTEATLSRAQLKASLWADDRLRVYAVPMGTRIPDLPAMLEGAQLPDHHCLRPGALSEAEAQRAAYLVQLGRESPFTDWLLFEAAALGDWGVLVRSASPMIALRGHLRGLCQAQAPDGRGIELDWMDPEILRALLPLFGARELAAFMGPMQSLTIPGAGSWTQYGVLAGQLQMRQTTVAGAG